MARTAGPTVLVTAAAGYGKTTFLESLAAGRSLGVLTATDLAGTDPAEQLRAAITADSTVDAQLVLDEFEDLPLEQQLRITRALGALPEGVQVCLACRAPLHPQVLAALRRPLLYRGPADLALTTREIALVLREEHDVAELEVAALISDLTAGWPRLVQLTAVALSQGIDAAQLRAAVAGPGTAGAAWIEEEVLATMPAQARHILDLTVDLEPITLPLLTAITADDSRPDPTRAGEAFDWLTATGVLVPLRPDGGHGEQRPVPLIAEVVARASRSAMSARATAQQVAKRRYATAASWYADNGHQLAAARASARAGDPGGAAELIESHGAEMVAAGAAQAVIDLVESLPAQHRGRYAVRLIEADALRTVSRPGAAKVIFDELVKGTDPTAELAPGLAWRIGRMHYTMGNFGQAEAVCARVRPEAAGADPVLAQACRASALAALGKSAESADLAAAAIVRAVAIGHDRALSAARLAAAYTAGGTRRDEHLAEALAAAQRAGDVISQARVLTNQVDGLLRQARYPQALDLANQAVTAAERSSLLGLLVTALCNAGDALLQLGEFTEAAMYFERAVRTSRRVGMNRTAMGLWGLAEVHRRSGRPEQARAEFEEAIDLARDGSDVQVLVPSLLGLSRLLLEADELTAARGLVEEAQRVAPPRLASPASAGAGWMWLAAGDLSAASAAAGEAVRAARAGRRLDHLADALELAAAVSTEPAVTRALLSEAETIWRTAGAAPAADRIAMVVGRLPGASGEERSAGKAAARRLSVPADGATAPVRIRVLGTFEVLVGGRPVPFTAWRSKQARTLIKILVARRGRPVLRSELCELLWPDSDPSRTAHRLSVLLSVVRTVLDPQHLWPVDHYLRADPVGLSLDQAHVAVDAEGLLQDAAHAKTLVSEGKLVAARQILTDVDQLYRGPAFEDEPAEDWAGALREHVRAVWLRSLRELAELSRKSADLRQTATILTRLLCDDPYDEDAHHSLVRVLVRSGRHGEARRAFERWAAAMDEIDAPAPDPCALGVPARVRSGG